MVIAGFWKTQLVGCACKKKADNSRRKKIDAFTVSYTFLYEATSNSISICEEKWQYRMGALAEKERCSRNGAKARRIISNLFTGMRVLEPREMRCRSDHKRFSRRGWSFHIQTSWFLRFWFRYNPKSQTYLPGD